MTVTKATLAATVATEVLEVDLESKTAGTADTQIVSAVPFAGTISAAEVILHAAVAGDNTNTRSFELQNKGQAGVGSASAATLALTTGNNVVAFDAKPMTLGSSGNRAVVAGDVLALVQTVGGTGLAHSGGIVRVTITRT